MASKILLSIPVAILLLASCSRSDQEEYEMSLRHVRQLLTDRDCDEALRITASLNESGNRSTDPVFLQLRSSSFACKGNYDDLKFFIENFPLVNNITDNSFHFSLASFYNANDNPDSSEYGYLSNAIDTLLYPGTVDTVAFASREELLGERVAHNFNTQVLYMILTKLGRYSRHYGNMGTNDENQLVKGLGDQGNTCFTDYTTTTSQGLRAVALSGSNPCTGDTDGHPDIQESISEEDRKRIMCEGITMINTIFEIINTTIPRIVNSRSLDDLTSLNQELCTNEFGNALICSVQTQRLCEQMSFDFIESFILLYFESLTDTTP